MKRLSVLQVLAPLILVVATFAITAQYAGRQFDLPPEYTWRENSYYTYHPYLYVISQVTSGAIEGPSDEFMDTFYRVLGVFLAGMITAIGGSYLIAVLRGKNRLLGIHGDARWATKKDLKENGLFATDGVVLGQTYDAKVVCKEGQFKKIKRKGRLIVDGGKTHVLMSAPTRAGKGAGPVTGSLLTFLGNVIVFDPKGENWETTAGWRRKFSSVLRFDPLEPNMQTIKMNPVAEVRSGDSAFKDANTIASILLGAEGDPSGNETSDHFKETAKDLLTGVILHVRFAVDMDRPRNLGTVLDYLSGDNVQSGAGEDMVAEMLTNMRDAEHSSAHDSVVKIMNRAIMKPEKELGSVISTANKALILLEDSLIRNALSRSEVSSASFQGDTPISLYMVVPFSDIARISPIIRLIVTFLTSRFTEGKTSAGKPAMKHKTLFLIDEFPVLGKFTFLKTVMGIAAGYGLRFFLIVQSLTQLEEVYGPKHPISEHCKTQVFFATGDIGSAEKICKTMGSHSIAEETVSNSGKKAHVGMSSMSLSFRETKKELFQPSQLCRLAFDKALILIQGKFPYMAKKVVFFLDDRFKKIANLPTPVTLQELQSEIPDPPDDTDPPDDMDGKEREKEEEAYSLPDDIMDEIYGSSESQEDQDGQDDEAGVEGSLSFEEGGEAGQHPLRDII